MYNRYIPQNGTYTRVVEQDGPEEGARRPAPHPPGPERGEPGENGPRGSAGPPPGAARGAPGGGGRSLLLAVAQLEEAAGLPRVPWALAAWGTCSQGRRAR